MQSRHSRRGVENLSIKTRQFAHEILAENWVGQIPKWLSDIASSDTTVDLTGSEAAPERSQRGIGQEVIHIGSDDSSDSSDEEEERLPEGSTKEFAWADDAITGRKPISTHWREKITDTKKQTSRD
ncbi:hypothetical protein THAOC_28402, partial [Thalassiosira oceanica]